MRFITEKEIDEVIEAFENDEAKYDLALSSFATTQPGVTAYLLGEDFDSLSDDERELMLYMCIIMYNAIIHEPSELPSPTTDDVEEAEDANWKKLENITAKKFSDRLDVFFEETPQEDLLAFFEDVLIEEEEMITKEGREPIFIALKSILDTWQAE